MSGDDRFLTYAVDPAQDPEAAAMAVIMDALSNLNSTTAQLRVARYVVDRIAEGANLEMVQ